MSLPVTIRPLEGIDEYRACVELQEETWGRGFSERVPTAILKVAQILGGVASGAWAGNGRLMGFVFGMTGIRDGVPVHWSDMLAVRPEARNTGLGRRLKLHQRDVVRAAGIGVVYWTFDPLRARNAHLNFVRLGIRTREYAQDMYGQTDSPLHRGVGTDRLVARWDLDAPWVEDRLSGRDPGPDPDRAMALPTAVGRASDAVGLPSPTAPDVSLDAPELRIVVPPDIGDIMERDPVLARRWREHTRIAFTHYLSRGWEVRDFVRDDRAPAYLLTRDPGSSSPSPTPVPRP